MFRDQSFELFVGGVVAFLFGSFVSGRFCGSVAASSTNVSAGARSVLHDLVKRDSSQAQRCQILVSQNAVQVKRLWVDVDGLFFDDLKVFETDFGVLDLDLFLDGPCRCWKRMNAMHTFSLLVVFAFCCHDFVLGFGQCSDVEPDRADLRTGR